MKIIAIILARSGSKGLKDKNIKHLDGKPLMAYSIEAALKSKIFDTVHVSTDSEHYADIAKEYGAEVPFLRSQAMSTDTAGSWDTVKEVLKNYEKIGSEFDIVTLLQPTSPLRTTEDILSAYKIFCDKQAQAVVSVCETNHSPLWSSILPPDGSMDGFLNRIQNIPRQQLPTYYRINGAIYMVKNSFLKENVDLYRKGCFAYVMDQTRSIDIDTELDFGIAEYLINRARNAIFEI